MVDPPELRVDPGVVRGGLGELSSVALGQAVAPGLVPGALGSDPMAWVLEQALSRAMARSGSLDRAARHGVASAAEAVQGFLDEVQDADDRNVSRLGAP